MSNEYKDWIVNRGSEVALDEGWIDAIYNASYENDEAIIHGCKDNEPITIRVWFSEEGEIWTYGVM